MRAIQMDGFGAILLRFGKTRWRNDPSSREFHTKDHPRGGVPLMGIVLWILRLAPFGLTVGCVAWIISQSPFTTPLVARSTAQIETSLTRAIAREVTLAWLLPRLQDALLAQDLDQLDLLVGLADEHGVVLPIDLVDDIAALNASRSGRLAQTLACGACALDVTACETIEQIGVCAVPFELTPAGDVNALRRASVDYVEGREVDQLDLGLAMVGLGATGAVMASGGTSYTLKAAASLLRLARRMGTLTPAFAARLGDLLGAAVHWDKMGDLVRLRIGPDQMLDSARIARLADLGGDLRRVANNTSVADTVVLLRHVDTAEDAARLARVSEAMGPGTRGAFEVLGKTRVFSALVRLSDLAVAAVVALYAIGLQIAVFFAQQLGNAGLRMGRRAARRGTGRPQI